MVKTTATIQCTNAQCGQAIPFDKTVCAECLTPVTKRYLHTLGTKLDFAQGELIGDRYICVSPQVVVDTKPREIPVLPSEVADRFLPYLKLFSCRNHIPQLYGQIALPMTVSKTKIWLAELGSFSHQEQERIWQDGQLLIPLLQAWGNASNLSKLNWLWQWARLWIPFQRQGVCSSLTDINLMGISSSLFKLVELNLDQAMVTLADLGETWQQLLPHSGQLSPLLQELCDRLISKSIVNPEYLVALLEGAMQSAAQGLQRDYRLYTLTDAGPTRDHNEDACFPEPGNLKLIPGDEGVPLAIVCDGIGGHEGGEVASGKSIKALSTTIPNIGMAADTWNSNHIRQQIDNFVCEANDEINGINDAELREDRKRMGTTLVMAVAYGHEMYLTHVGDSRIYFISSQGAQQLTVDDDLASREVRLGYAFYRDAIQYPSGGALVQAIGMNQSNNLYPNIQKFILDRDGIFLLCSDGLSDFDRVEEYWEQEIMPILSGQLDIEDAVKNLLHLANTKNGHDNSTIALLHCQVRPRTTADTIPLDLQTLSQHLTIDPLLPEADLTTSPFIDQSSLNFQTTKLEPSPNEPPEVGTKTSDHHHRSSPLENPFIILAIVLGVGAILWAILSLFAEKLWWQLDPSKDNPSPPIETVENSSSQAPEPISKPPQVYQVLETKEITILDANSSGPEIIQVNLPAGAIVQLSGERDQITICNLKDKDKGIEQGNVFVLAEETRETIASSLTLLPEPTVDQLGICNEPPN